MTNSILPPLLENTIFITSFSTVSNATSRIAVWGWSGGGSATQNLMFQYPNIYKTGIAIAGVASQFTYDNIYQERYMGLPQEDSADFKAGSPITYAKNLQGHLLLIHGTGDDNVHYQNMELLVNELVKDGKLTWGPGGQYCCKYRVYK